MVYTFNPNSGDLGRSLWVQDQQQLQMMSCLKKEKENKKKEK